MRLNASIKLYGDLSRTRQAADDRLIPPNFRLFGGLSGAMDALGERGNQIGHGGNGLRGGAAFRVEAAIKGVHHAVPTTDPSACSAIARAASGVRMPKPTQTGNLVWPLIRATASPTTPESALALPVMPLTAT